MIGCNHIRRFFMKYMPMLLTVLFLPHTAWAQINCYGSDISTSCSNGVTYNQFGDTMYGSDGSSFQRFGDTIYSDDGTSYNQYGDTFYGSDGSIVHVTRMSDTDEITFFDDSQTRREKQEKIDAEAEKERIEAEKEMASMLGKDNPVIIDADGFFE